MTPFESAKQRITERLARLVASLRQCSLPVGRYYLCRPMLFGAREFAELPNPTQSRDKIEVLASYDNHDERTIRSVVDMYVNCVEPKYQSHESISDLCMTDFDPVPNWRDEVCRVALRYLGKDKSPYFPTLYQLNQETQQIWGLSLEAFNYCRWHQLLDLWRGRKDGQADELSQMLKQPLPPPLPAIETEVRHIVLQPPRWL